MSGIYTGDLAAPMRLLATSARTLPVPGGPCPVCRRALLPGERVADLPDGQPVHVAGCAAKAAQVSARYWVLVSDELMDSKPEWPDGLRPIEPATAPPADPGMTWWLFEDDGAPATLDGKRVELLFTRSGDKTMIGGRRPHI